MGGRPVWKICERLLDEWYDEVLRLGGKRETMFVKNSR